MKTVKKHICTMLALLSLVPLTSCGSAGETTGPQTEAAAPDLDLTILSSTLVFSELQNITANPDNYAGQSIRMRGQCQTYYNELAGSVYHAVTVADTTSCCAQGLEYVLPDEASYPADGSEATIVGRLAPYEENGYIYFHLIDAEVV